MNAHRSSTPVVPAQVRVGERGERERERPADLGAVQERRAPGSRRRGTPSRRGCRRRTSSPRPGRARRSPHPAMRKYAGTSVSSKNKKNKSTSRLTNEPDRRRLQEQQPRERGTGAQPLGCADDGERARRSRSARPAAARSRRCRCARRGRTGRRAPGSRCPGTSRRSGGSRPRARSAPASSAAATPDRRGPAPRCGRGLGQQRRARARRARAGRRGRRASTEECTARRSSRAGTRGAAPAPTAIVRA